MEQALIQVRVDKELKDEVTEIYAAQGLDLTTAVRIFLHRSKMTRGLPFELTLPNNIITRTEAKSAFYELRRQAADIPEMTLEEINAEISATRESRKGK